MAGMSGRSIIPPTRQSASRRPGLLPSRLTLGLSRDASLLFWGLFCWEFGFGLYMYLMTLYMESLGASSVQIGFLVGTQGLARFLMYLPAGIIAERYSRRLIIVWTTFITVPAVLSFAVAQTWWHLLPGLILFVGGNLGTPAFSSYIAEAGAPNRARAFALIYTVGPSIALIVSPVAGGWIADLVSLRVIFYLSAIAFLIATAIMWQLSERPLSNQGTANTSYLEAFREPIIRAVSLLQLAVLAALGLGTTLLPNYLHDVRGISLADIGNFGSIAALGSVILSVAVGRSAWLTAIRAIAIATLSVGLLCAITLLTEHLWVLAIAFLGRGGLMVAWSLFAAVLSDTTPVRLQARAYAIAELLGSIGFGLAPFAAGALYDWRKGSPLLATALAAPALAAAALWIERRFVRPAMAARLSEAEPAPGVTPATTTTVEGIA
jgi:MFS family permease